MASPSRVPSTRRPHGAMGGRSRPVSMIEPGFTALDPPAQETTTSTSAKRRSLLPQLSRSGSSDYRGETDMGRENEDPEREPEAGRVGVEGESARQADRKAMPPPPSKLGRPQSVRIPGSGQLGRAPSTRAHTRTQSKEASVPARPRTESSSNSATAGSSESRPTSNGSGLQRTSSIRQPQQPSRHAAGLSRSSSIRAPQTQSHSRAGSTTTTATTTLKRLSVSNGRPSSINTAIAGQAPSTRSPTSPTKTHDLRAGSRSHMPPPSRPNFNTFQQHYSPAKSGLPKPPLPSTRQSKQPAPTPEDTTISSETSKQQLELLQLSLLHQTSTQTLTQYTASGKRKLGRKHAKLRTELQSLLAAEQQHQRLANLETLQAWCPDSTFLIENLQLLARIHRDLTALTASESRYTHLIQSFEAWIASTETDTRDDFVDPLSGQWREAHASVALKARSLQREMATLPPLPTVAKDDDGELSGLEVLVEGCRMLVDGVLRELDVMSKLEKGVLDAERARIDEEVGGVVVQGLESGGDGWWVPAWEK